jgi:FtsP/CotA-like multicopper oxidase with cupredoxin domain
VHEKFAAVGSSSPSCKSPCGSHEEESWKGVEMKKLFLAPLLLLFSSLAFGQTPVPVCSPNNPPPNCTDYFGVANWANSPLPAGGISGYTVVASGSGYVNPVVTIMDATGTGATAGAVTIGVGGAITAIAAGTTGSGYFAPQITIVDLGAGGSISAPTCGGVGQPACGSGALATAVIGGTITGGIHKFVTTDLLPDLKGALAVADTTTFPGSDYYEIVLVETSWQMHSDLPATKVRGYVQVPSGSTGCPVSPAFSYLGPSILAQKNRPVRVKFTNCLPIGTGGNLFIPTDTTYMGAGAPYTQNRATLHLHGGATPWISDGTPHQWTVPVGETGVGVPERGDSTQLVPDMWFDSTGKVVPAGTPLATNDPGQGSLTFFWTNQQGGRLMFYHDHAYGITRLNVYSGEAAGYLLYDPAEEAALLSATVPGTIAVNAAQAAPDLGHLIPLVIQDKTFVPSAAQMASQDPTWTAGGFGTVPGAVVPGDLWFPHVYSPNQNPADIGGANGFGRWDYGPWTLPGAQTLLSAASPASAVSIACTSAAFPNQTVQCPITPNPSGTPEGFMDTPLVNGKAYPVLHVAPAAYRFKILSAGNDRSLNLQLYVADPTVITPDGRTNTEVKMVPAVQPAAGAALPLCTTLTPITNTTLFMGLATAVLDASGNPINGTGLPPNCWPNFGAGTQTAGIPIQQTMWGADGRAGGVPDPTKAGPPFIQIGTEGGLLPAPVVIPSMPTGYEANTRSVTITNVSVHGLWLGPAERADAIVDFSAFAGQTLILYNDAPTPAPAIDSRLDYFTGDGDQTPIGGAPNTLPGYGPNTRTIMQIIVDQTAPNTVPFSLSTLSATLPGVFAQTQPVPVVPEPSYPPASGAYSATPSYALISDASLTFYPIGSTTPVTFNDERKAIQELFTLDYGRMNATLGVELPLTNFLTQTTIPLGYIDPPTEVIKQGDTQFWKITHNGVDTHFIHFHMFNVQVINRMAWDGTKRPPDANELGWKDTVRMNPLEDILVVLQPIKPITPFPVVDSYRLLDVTMPANSNCPALTATSTPTQCSAFTNVDPATNNPTQTPNKLINFGWEYVWHCHILGHEESDMMRAIIFQAPPEAPSSLIVAPAATGLNLSWTDNSASETGFTLQRDTSSSFAAPTSIAVGASLPTGAGGQGITWGVSILYNDTSADNTGATTYFYRVQAFKPDANYWTPGANITSTWSNTATFGTAVPFAAIAPTSLAFGNVPLNSASVPQTVTLSNTGTGPFTYTAAILGANLGDFAVTSDVCAGTVTAASTCAISVTFTPTVTGPESANLIFTTNDPANPTLGVSLTGVGGALPLLTITASNATMKYGGAVPIITASYSPANPAGLTPPKCTTSANSVSPAGSYATTCAGAVDANYTIVYVAGTISVTPVPLTIWAPNLKMNVGGPLPATITPSYVGFVAGDTAATLAIAPNIPPACTTTATVLSPIGNYPITCSGAVDSNYTISYVSGTLTIAQGVLTITAPSPTMAYGGVVPALAPTYSVNPVIGMTTLPTCTTSATSTSPVGTYPVTCSGAVDSNYVIGYVAGILTITPAPLTITAPSPTMTYGGPLPSLAPVYTGFVAGDSAATLAKAPNSSPACSTTATINSIVGTYPFTCSGAVDANYAISYVAGTLTVNPAVVTITASSSTMTYGGTVPTITPSFSGFVLGQTNTTVLTTQPTCSTTATTTSPVSPPTYTSSCTGAAGPNYTFTYVPGNVTINGAPLTITANNAGKIYGQTLTFSGTAFTSTPLLNGDTVTSVTLTSAGSGATAVVGSYPIVPSAAVGTGLANYTITYVNGNLIVNPAPLTITANNLTKIYGQTLTFLGTEFTPTGLLNGNTVTSVTLISPGTPAAASVGSYPIVPSGAIGTGLNNYTISYVNGSLGVVKASTTAAITSNVPNPAIIGQIVTVSFGVAPQFTGLPTGSVRVTASTGQTCTGVLSAGAGSCTLIFPIGGSRTLTATYFTGDTNFLASPASAPVTQVVSSVSLSTRSLLFGNQLVGTNSARQAVTLSNVGVAPLAITSITVLGTNPGDFNFNGNCPIGGNLGVGRSCSMNVRFSPTAIGVRTATLTITDADATSPQTVSLTGTGVAPVAVVSPTSIDFGTQAVGTPSAPSPITLSNTGNAALVINSINIGGANTGSFSQTNNCPIGGAGLAPGVSCTINVIFQPTRARVRNANVTISDNAANSPQTVTLTGTGQ